MNVDNGAQAKFLQFPTPESPPKEPVKESWWANVRWGVRYRVRAWAASALSRFTGGVLVGGVREFRRYDPVTGQVVSISRKTSGYILTIDGRDYFFSLTGRFQGTGSSL